MTVMSVAKTPLIKKKEEKSIIMSGQIPRWMIQLTIYAKKNKMLRAVASDSIVQTWSSGYSRSYHLYRLQQWNRKTERKGLFHFLSNFFKLTTLSAVQPGGLKKTTEQPWRVQNRQIGRLRFKITAIIFWLSDCAEWSAQLNSTKSSINIYIFIDKK